MLVRYDFDKILDLSRFRKQFLHYIPKMMVLNIEEVKYHFSLRMFQLSVEIRWIENPINHIVKFYISEVLRDGDKEIIAGKNISPLGDTRFQEIKLFKDFFDSNYATQGLFISYDVLYTVDIVCQIVKFLHKINNLKIFL